MARISDFAYPICGLATLMTTGYDFVPNRRICALGCPGFCIRRLRRALAAQSMDGLIERTGRHDPAVGWVVSFPLVIEEPREGFVFCPC